ncbi:N-acetylneuraminate 9-O-acetyltransferase-like [Daphnia pulicaria]|uniref:N-acetylneuraminate 9-O-acetyltransferase-like n=1 Tax=Daphnia pulicaria TaxID=35523 RepID=UPI001EEBB5A3|nr:N-acetylneuraminate 9-O-acetyltransferase-like [Daphnia pulicaria]
MACLDILNQEQKPQIPRQNTKELHFVFMGDSRIRQQFFNFLRLIPDYDQKTQPDPMPFNNHEDMDLTSAILKLHVSFKWRPLINTNVTDTIRQWVESPPSQRPNWILLGMEVHHMLTSNGTDYYQYLKKLTEIRPLLEHCAKFSQVIWLNQYPTIDPNQWDISSEKIHRYNEGIKSSLKNYSQIQIWDSSNIFAEEYVRGCRVFSERETAGKYSLQYTSCRDYIHTGYTALSQATQLLLNQICNLKLVQLI